MTNYIQPTIEVFGNGSCDSIIVKDTTVIQNQQEYLGQNISCVSLAVSRLGVATKQSSGCMGCGSQTATTTQAVSLDVGGTAQSGCLNLEFDPDVWDDPMQLVGQRLILSVYESHGSLYEFEYTIVSEDIADDEPGVTTTEAIRLTSINILNKLYQVYLNYTQKECLWFSLSIPDCITNGQSANCFLTIRSLFPGFPLIIQTALSDDAIEMEFTYEQTQNNTCNFSRGGEKSVSIGCAEDAIYQITEGYQVTKPGYGRLVIRLDQSAYLEDYVVILGFSGTLLPNVPYSIMSTSEKTVSGFVETFNRKMLDSPTTASNVRAVVQSATTASIYFTDSYLLTNSLNLTTVGLLECNQAGTCSAAVGSSIISAVQEYSEPTTYLHKSDTYVHTHLPGLYKAYTRHVLDSANKPTGSDIDGLAAKIANYIETINILAQRGDYGNAAEVILQAKQLIAKSKCC